MGLAPATLRVAPARAEDDAAIAAIHRAAFGGESEVELLEALRRDPTAAPSFSLVAFDGDTPTGHILFTGATVEHRDGSTPAALLCPLAVSPAAQRTGCGAALIAAGMSALRVAGIGAAFVFGDPAYYTRFGFLSAQPLNITPPHPVPAAYRDAFMHVSVLADPPRAGTLRCARALDDPALWQV